ncbi:MAG: CDP-alcohol phosphatidyltransferase family protein [Hyphomonas oceanitis]|uniref:CDP-alcohol phosphatidyltransferase family protein n=1 Tax=Hyphomonas oceanitis TaxID=81033 RepID=UPI003002807C
MPSAGNAVVMDFKWLPNALTIARCVFAGLVIWGIWNAELAGVAAGAVTPDMPPEDLLRHTVMQQLWYQFALLGFLSGALTDFLDGYLARKLKAQSRFGVWLDPIADKLLVGAALLGLAMVLKTWLIYLPAAAIIGRDVFMTWLRTTPAGKAVVDPSNLAKWKTGFEMAAIIGLMLPLAFAPADMAADASGETPLVFVIGSFMLVGLLWVAAALSLMTGWRYIRATRR